MIYYSDKDVKAIAEIIKNNNFKKIYVTGQTNTGKSCFSDTLSKMTRIKHVNLDKERDNNPLMQRNEVLKNIISENKDNVYILDFYDLLNTNYDNQNTLEDWIKEADILIFLNPPRPKIKNGFDYDIAPNLKKDFDKLEGELMYENDNTNTYMKRLDSHT